jgi:hypothetical protein
MAAIDEILFQKAEAYASRHRIKIARRLGFGIHGLVLEGERVADAARTAIKIHKDGEPYHRERAIYERLAQHVVREIRGFNVPRLINCDEDLRVIEMTVVVRPFVLDFAGAYLEERPDFPEDVWEQWEQENESSLGLAGQRFSKFSMNWKTMASSWRMFRQATSLSSIRQMNETGASRPH